MIPGSDRVRGQQLYQAVTEWGDSNDTRQWQSEGTAIIPGSDRVRGQQWYQTVTEWGDSNDTRQWQSEGTAMIPDSDRVRGQQWYQAVTEWGDSNDSRQWQSEGTAEKPLSHSILKKPNVYLCEYRETTSRAIESTSCVGGGIVPLPRRSALETEILLLAGSQVLYTNRDFLETAQGPHQRCSINIISNNL